MKIPKLVDEAELIQTSKRIKTRLEQNLRYGNSASIQLELNFLFRSARMEILRECMFGFLRENPKLA
jgi:hypothetical protein